jgi:hypothetical protein
MVRLSKQAPKNRAYSSASGNEDVMSQWSTAAMLNNIVLAGTLP